ncbi:putative signal transducing protein [Flavobacterium daejeonense]|uniref:DUF2007 domain-containing protein n=1 Tax=Flavobacterium daejeonense TaxID=350893 RepID=UPI00047D31D2|nr:DUF2007 domain-containing protein [Flavobacterium daejeonense]
MEDYFELIGRYQYSSEAIILKGKLEAEGIAVFMRDNNTVDANPLYSNAIGGVKLFVYKDNYSKAMEIISQVSEYSLDDACQLMKCPNCGAEEIDRVTSIKDFKSLFAFVFSIFLGSLPFYSKHKYKCVKCKFEFN